MVGPSAVKDELKITILILTENGVLDKGVTAGFEGCCRELGEEKDS
jgi:hypothetical protein